MTQALDDRFIPLDERFTDMAKAKVSGALTRVLEEALASVQTQIDRNIDRLLSDGALTGDMAIAIVAEGAALRSVRKRMVQNIRKGKQASRDLKPQMEG